jgi:hypothetical protein
MHAFLRHLFRSKFRGLAALLLIVLDCGIPACKSRSSGNSSSNSIHDAAKTGDLARVKGNPELASNEAENTKIKVTRHDAGSVLKPKPVEVLAAERMKVVFRVDGIPVQAELKGELILTVGSQRVVSSELKTSWIPINDSYGFEDLQIVDFDQDRIEDAVATFTWGGGGSGWAVGHLCVSSKTRKAYLYESFTGSNYWNNEEYEFPEIRNPFYILEIPDWMPRFQVKGGVTSLSHPESVSFVFTHVWNGNGFSYKPIAELYKKILPKVKDIYAKALVEPEPEPGKKAFYQLILEDYRKAAEGLKVSIETQQSSDWQLLKEFNPVPQ